MKKSCRKGHPSKKLTILGGIGILLCLPLACVGAAWIIFQIFATQNVFLVCLLALFLCLILGYETYFLFQFYTE